MTKREDDVEIHAPASTRLEDRRHRASHRPRPQAHPVLPEQVTGLGSSVHSRCRGIGITYVAGSAASTVEANRISSAFGPSLFNLSAPLKTPADRRRRGDAPDGVECHAFAAQVATDGVVRVSARDA